MYGTIPVHRMCCAIDCSRVINPAGIISQVESCIAMALSATLGGEITIRDESIQQTNFSNYPILRMDQMPQVDVSIIESNLDPLGASEPPIPSVAPSVADAIFDATGIRLRYRPIPPSGISMTN